MPSFCVTALLISITLSNLAFAESKTPPSFPVSILVNAEKKSDELKPIWRMFGADEPNYATMKYGKKLISELGHLRKRDIFFELITYLAREMEPLDSSGVLPAFISKMPGEIPSITGI